MCVILAKTEDIFFGGGGGKGVTMHSVACTTRIPIFGISFHDPRYHHMQTPGVYLYFAQRGALIERH